MHAASSTSDDADARTMTLTRLVDAPRDLVWQAFTDPEILPLWWGPRIFSCQTKEIDIRPGGQWRFTMVGPEGLTYANRIRYEELAKPGRIVMVVDDDGGDMAPFRSVITFDARGEKTLVTMAVTLASAEIFAAMVEFGAVEGGESTLDCLEEKLADLASGAIVLTLTRLIDAPRSLVWQAWTDPAHATQWGPAGYTMDYMETEVRPGAPWRASLTPKDGGPVLWQGGVFQIVEEPARLVFTFAWDDEDGRPGEQMLLDLTFEAVGAKTRLTLRQTGFTSVPDRDGHAVGWGEALAALAAHVTSL